MFFNGIIPDHNANVFHPPETGNATRADSIVLKVFGGFRRWDAVYFLHVAEHGYIYENSLAFFPLFPVTVRWLASAVHLVLGWCLTLSSAILISAVMLNVVYFVLSAVFLFHASRLITRSIELSCVATLLYCINPASIFFSAGYSESMFAAATFCGLILCEKNRLLAASMVFGLSSGTRSNGIISAGFVVYRQLKNTVHALSIESKPNVAITLLKCNIAFFSSIMYAFICIVPFLAYQYHAYQVFCKNEEMPINMVPQLVEFGRENGFKLPEYPPPPWCSWTVPISYSYIQQHYWDVGFMRYYQLRQLPNFFLATPVIVLSSKAVFSYLQKKIGYALYLGLWEEKEEQRKIPDGFFSSKCYVYIVHCGVLLCMCLLFLHIQVTTRFICSSSPVLYWYCAHRLNSCCKDWRWSADLSATDNILVYFTNIVKRWQKTDAFAKFIVLYFISYFIVGTAMHCNFLPWT